MKENRLLIISLEKETVTRVSERTAHKRNKYVEKLADELRLTWVQYKKAIEKVVEMRYFSTFIVDDQQVT